jgi:hypothetical protein
VRALPASDVFISYKSEQASWARRLHDDLIRYGFSVFLDHDPARGLQAGDEWETRIREEAAQARHFLLLWSSKIQAASYVMKEIQARQDARRPITVVRLDDSAPMATLDSTKQAFRDLIELARDVDDADRVDFFAWNRAVSRLVNTTPLADQRPAGVVEVPIVVVAMTHGQAVELAAAKNVVPLISPGTFREVMDLLGQAAPFDPDRYGVRPENWKPFDSASEEADTTVEQVVARFDQTRRSWLQEHPDDDPAPSFAFLSFTDLLSDQATSQSALDYLKVRPSLVVLDPVSLMHNQVWAYVIRNSLYSRDRAFVIGLGPQLTAAASPLHSYFDRVERGLFESLNMDDPHNRSRSFRPMQDTCVFNVCHGFEFSRWLNIASEAIAGTGRSGISRGWEGVLQKGRTTLPGLVSQGGTP